MPQKVAKSITRQLSSLRMVSSQMTAFQVPPEPFKDHPRTCGRLIGPRNKPQEKQTGEL